MLIRAMLLYGLVAAVTELAILATVPLPEIPLLRYILFATPLIGAVVVVREWLAAGAPSPMASASRDVPAQASSRARFVQERSPSAR